MPEGFFFTFYGRGVKLILTWRTMYTQKQTKGTNCTSLLLCFKNRYNLSMLLHLLNSQWFSDEEILATCIFRHQFRHENQTLNANHEKLYEVSGRRMCPTKNSSEQTADCGAHLPSGGRYLSFCHNNNTAY